MLDLSEDNVARLLARDAAQLAERAREIGVTAYMQKPVHRTRPNEQFLQATLRNIQTGNQRSEENAMWRQRQAQISGDKTGVWLLPVGMPFVLAAASTDNTDCRPKRAAGVVATETNKSACGQRHERHTSEQATLDMLSSLPVRGRGGVGSRVDEAGPYLPANSLHMAGEQVDTTEPPSVVLGPERPHWICTSSLEPSQPSNSVQPRHNSQLNLTKHKISLDNDSPVKRHKSDKPKKHHKTKHKHKHRHKQSRRADSL